MEKKKRLQLITKILQRRTVTDQNALMAELKKAGVMTSQASLSRDLKVLGVHRVRAGDGRFCYSLPEDKPSASSLEVFRRRFATSVIGVRRSNFIVLLFTPPGEAQLVGRLLDQITPSGLLGTVAGDDTIICVTKNEANARKLEKEFKEILE